MTGKDWFIVNVTSGKEAAACSVLGRKGYDETFYPKRRIEVPAQKRAAQASKGKKGPRFITRAWVPGYVFVCTFDVACYDINGPHGQLHMRVISPGGEPYRVSDAAMARMADVPKRVRELVDDAVRAEREAWEAVRPVKGEPAEITAGPFSGFVGIVREIRKDEVQIDVGLMPVWVSAMNAERVAPAA